MSNERATKELKIRKPERTQIEIITASIDDFIDENHLARRIWAFIEGLDTTTLFSALKTQEGKPGQRAIDRRVLLSLWLYAIISGIISGREIERKIKSDNAFRWLAGGLNINYHTIDDFRSQNEKSFEDIMAQLMASMVSAEILSGETIAIDGMKISAKAKGSRFHRKDKIEEHLEQAKAYLKELNNSSEKQINLKKAAAEKRAARERVAKCEKALATFEELSDKSDKARVSITDSESRIMKGGNGAGYRPAYNVQVATDMESFVIAGIEVTQDHNDSSGIKNILPTLEKNLPKYPKSLVTDAGYPCYKHLHLLEEKGIEYYSQQDKKKRGRKSSPISFFRENSTFDKSTETLVCPAGKIFQMKAYAAPDGFIDYKFTRNKKSCEECNLLERCLAKRDLYQTISFKIKNSKHESLIKKLAKNNESTTGIDLLKKRFSMELPHAVIKQRFRYRQVCVQTINRVKSEILLVVLAHNFLRWQSLQRS